ncbi:Cytochrome P450 monooxygenase [Hyphodiscus hymeniophilus]|uniref:Cytochrome P450 monooxygenase n=1 Tax=Hyphodiscus hymeniophilus TaxID=353542 RepID=A0A9P6SQK0_9HELO|nr:Cytochrome P450 monooxygenase [Hyphodiscus hymeniophilus]
MIFREILKSNLPPEEKSLDRLWHDAQTLNIAGSETTSSALGNITYYLLAQPDILKRLRDELATVVKDGRITETTTAELEKLPYLTAVIKEGLRLSFGTAGRLYRISPDKSLIYNDGKRQWDIPAGTPVAMSTPLLHLNAKTFPSPTSFDPTRWLDNPQLDRYLVSFSKGPRNCVGMNLAWAELYNTITAVFGHYGGVECEGPRMELYKTTERDVLLAHEYFMPFTWEGSEGVRVTLSS